MEETRWKLLIVTSYCATPLYRADEVILTVALIWQPNIKLKWYPHPALSSRDNNASDANSTEHTQVGVALSVRRIKTDTTRAGWCASVTALLNGSDKGWDLRWSNRYSQASRWKFDNNASYATWVTLRYFIYITVVLLPCLWGFIAFLILSGRSFWQRLKMSSNFRGKQNVPH